MGNLITSEVKYCTKHETICTSDIVILMGIENQLKIKMESSEKERTLSEEDIIVLNSKTPVSIKATRALYAEFLVSYRKFRELFSHKKYRFFCDSTNTKNDNFAILRKYLTELLILQYENTEYQLAEWNKVGCELLIFLVSNFATDVFTTENHKSLENVTDYISEHFQEELSLKQISSQFHMTPTYFSRFFKKNLDKIIYVFLTIFLYLLKCPQSLILSALRAFCFCGKPRISRSIFLYFRYQAWLKSW